MAGKNVLETAEQLMAKIGMPAKEEQVKHKKMADMHHADIEIVSDFKIPDDLETLTPAEMHGDGERGKVLHLTTARGLPVLQSNKHFYENFVKDRTESSRLLEMYLPTPAESYFICKWYQIENPDDALVLPHHQLPPASLAVITPHQAVLWWACVIHSLSDCPPLVNIIAKRIESRRASFRDQWKFHAGQPRLPSEVFASQVHDWERHLVLTGQVATCVINKDPECLQFKRNAAERERKQAKRLADQQAAAAAAAAEDEERKMQIAAAAAAAAVPTSPREAKEGPSAAGGKAKAQPKKSTPKKTP
jgi:hypothetical protein